MSAPPRSFWKRLKEIDLFFQKDDAVHKSMRRVAKRLERAGIPYAVVGGMAVNAHGHERTTKDVDLLLTVAGLAAFQRQFVPKNYRGVEQRPRRFSDRTSKVTLDVLVTGRFPGSGRPGPVVFPDPAEVGEIVDKVRVVNFATLLELKLAARRHSDFGDVVALIRVHDLDEAYADRLHPSVREDYIECLEEKRREDEYEARQ
jgi:hypothetical protein